MWLPPSGGVTGSLLRIITAVLIALLLSSASGSTENAPAYDRAPDYDQWFTGDTMRVDYFHTGGPKAGETLALDRVVTDGPWSGSRTQLADTTDLGKYLFEVRDKASGALLYSRGFASLYGEWETTGEEKTLHRTFHESLRFPWPTEPVGVVLKKRQADNRFAPVSICIPRSAACLSPERL